MRFGMELDPIEEIPALFAVLEQHQAGNTQHRDEVLNHHVHGQAEHLAVKEAAENIRYNGQSEDREQVFGFKAQKRHPRPQVSLNGRHIKRHRCSSEIAEIRRFMTFVCYVTPAVPWLTKNSATR